MKAYTFISSGNPIAYSEEKKIEAKKYFTLKHVSIGLLFLVLSIPPRHLINAFSLSTTGNSLFNPVTTSILIIGVIAVFIKMLVKDVRYWSGMA